MHKLGLYVDVRIPEYWIVDGLDRTICAIRLGQGDVIADDTLAWHPAGAKLPLVINFGDVFAPPKP